MRSRLLLTLGLLFALAHAASASVIVVPVTPKNPGDYHYRFDVRYRRADARRITFTIVVTVQSGNFGLRSVGHVRRMDPQGWNGPQGVRKIAHVASQNARTFTFTVPSGEIRNPGMVFTFTESISDREETVRGLDGKVRRMFGPIGATVYTVRLKDFLTPARSLP